MALAVAFDILQFAHRLRESGFTEQQADAVTQAIKEAASSFDLATSRNA
ncbi:MAG: hypothetical protein FD153_2105 [Rhodospirillaceae bacterium]|nr:MAG: hypothetical protein FD153_2105 [Rhodospirillaceae bacterium]